jgi:glyoxylase-like metal-dependent hydrolase (beta-lactamase superfamily II)/rhodanese-related sulfurtransferase
LPRPDRTGKLCDVDLELFVTPGLGDNSYLVASGDEAIVVDPQRDVARFLSAAESRGVRIRHILETHIHNDYLSGAMEIRRATGAEIVGPRKGGYEFPHRPVDEGDEITVGDLVLTVIDTPGHTFEHVAYVAREAGGDQPVAVFTGGSLMVGGAGRTDLLGPASTDELTRAQYRSLRRLAGLPSSVQVLPTHGAGSFCGAGPSNPARTSIMGDELTQNRALLAGSEDDFVRQQLEGLLAYPTYYAHMAPLNRRGPRPLADVATPRPLSAQDVADRERGGVWVIDARWRIPFARAHVPGSLNVELVDSFGSYVGWVVPFDEPLILVLPDPLEESLDRAQTQLLRIGYEHVEGYLDGGIVAWQAAGLPTDTYPTAGLEELCRAHRAGRVPHLLDVRQQTEWDAGHIADSDHVFVGDLPGRIDEVSKDGEVWVVCATGHRASTAASILDRNDRSVRLVEGTGVNDFLTHCDPSAKRI